MIIILIIDNNNNDNNYIVLVIVAVTPIVVIIIIFIIITIKSVNKARWNCHCVTAFLPAFLVERRLFNAMEKLFFKSAFSHLVLRKQWCL